MSDDRKFVRDLFTTDVAYEAFFEDSMLGIAIVDTEGVFVSINETFLGLLGFSRAEMIGKSWQYFTHPDDLQQDLDNLKLAHDTSEPYRLEKRYRNKAGQYLKTVMRVVPLLDGYKEVFISSILPVQEIQGVIEKETPEGPVKAVDYSWSRIIADNPRQTWMMAFLVVVLGFISGNLDNVIQIISKLLGQ